MYYEGRKNCCKSVVDSYNKNLFYNTCHMNTNHPIFGILEQAANPMDSDERASFARRWSNYDLRIATQEAVTSSMSNSL